MANFKFDAIVIGSGPGGEGAAMKLAKSGKKVAIIEDYEFVGGNSCHYGTIPSKVLRQSIQDVTTYKSNPMFYRVESDFNVSYPQLLKRSKDVVEKQVKMRFGFYQKNGIQVIHGFASFLDANTIEVSSSKEKKEKYKAEVFFIAVGSSPYHPLDVDFSLSKVLDSNTVLELEGTPSSITVYGAGVIGCEYASIFQNLGVQVNLINTQDHLLSFLDDEITDALSYHLRDQGVTLYNNEVYKKIDSIDDEIILNLNSGKDIKSDYLFWANGRSGNTNGLGLNNIGIKVNGRKQIDVNKNYQSQVKNVYAVGDVIGYPGLASASFDQGRQAAGHFLGEENLLQLNLIPTGIYTSPEISSVGKTEQELSRDHIPYDIGHSTFKNLTRAQILGTEVGILKLLFHRETLELLGVHCFGVNAAEIIHIGQIVMTQKEGANTIKSFVQNTFNYPTMAEAYRIAALNGLSRV